MLYAGIAAVGCLFLYTLFLKNRGKTLEEMESLFGTFFKWRSSSRELKKEKVEIDNTNYHIQVETWSRAI